MHSFSLTLNDPMIGNPVFGGDIDIFDTGARTVEIKEDYKLASADISASYGLDLDAYWSVELGTNSVDLSYDLEVDFFAPSTTGEGEDVLFDTSRWDVTDFTLADTLDTSSANFDVGLDYDLQLDVQNATIDVIGLDPIDLSASLSPVSEADRLSILSGEIGEDGFEFGGVIGDYIDTVLPIDGSRDIPAVPGLSFNWRGSELNVENSASGTSLLTNQSFDFDVASEDNEDFVFLNLDVDEFLQAIGVLPINPTNPEASVLDYEFSVDPPIFDEVTLLTTILDIDLELGLELERRTEFVATSITVEVLDGGTVVATGALGDTISVANSGMIGDTLDYDVRYSVEGEYKQVYGVSINLTPQLQALAGAVGFGEVEFETAPNGVKTSSLSGNANLEFEGFDIIQVLKDQGILPPEFGLSSGFIPIKTVTSTISLASDTLNSFSTEIVDPSEGQIDVPDGPDDPSNGGDNATGMSGSCIDVNDPGYMPDPQPGSQQYCVYEIIANKVIDGGSGTDTAWITGNGGSSNNGVVEANVGERVYFSSSSQLNSLLDSLSVSNPYIVTGGSRSVSISNVETINVDGGINNDLVAYLNGDEYYGGSGTDTFAADWSNQSVALSWTLGTGAATTLGNGVTVGGFEKLHVRLGTGDDVVSVASGNFASTTDSQYLDGGAGDDTLIGSNRRDILIGGIGNDILDGGDGNDALDGGIGNDVLRSTIGGTLQGGDGDDTIYLSELGVNSIIDGGSGTDTAWITGNGGSSNNGVVEANVGERVYFSSSSQLNSLLDSLSVSNPYIVTGGSRSVSISNVETINVDGGINNDLVAYLNGDEYYGGSGTDTFAADWSNQSVALSWTLGTGAATTLGNGVTVGGFEKLHVRLGTGDDVVSVASGNFASTTDSQYLDGGAGDDTLIGSNRRDILIGGIGNDILDGGDGNDALDGGIGNDVLRSTIGGTLQGGDGDDTIYLSELGVNSIIDGGSGTDTAWITGNGGSSNNGVVEANVGERVYFSSSSQLNSLLDSLSVSNPYIVTGGSRSVSISNVETINVDGGINNDLVAYLNGDEYYGGSGTDTFAADWSNQSVALSWTLGTGAATTLGNGVTVGGFEKLHVRLGTGDDVVSVASGNFASTTDSQYLDGGAGDDTLIGSNRRDILIGGIGNDILDGGDGNDALDGGIGNDVLRSTIGGTLQGGDGDDTIYLSELGVNSIIDGGSGTDTAWITGNGGSSNNGVVEANVGERVYFSSSSQLNSLLDSLSVSNPYIVTGGSRSVSISNVETINVDGGINNDLVAYLNGDEYYGGSGTDTFAADWSNQSVALSWTLGTGAATTLGNGVTVGGFEKLHVRLGTGDDVVSVASGNFASTTDSQYLDGGAGDDTLIGSNRRDILIGGIGNDILDGGDGNDALDGGIGNDVLRSTIGGTLQGGDGDDTIYLSELGVNSIIDGGSGTDTAWITGNGGSSNNGVVEANVGERVYFSSSSQLNSLLDSLSVSNPYIVTGGSRSVSISNVETINVDGGINNDLVAYLNGDEYYGGSGTDTFAADWSNQSVALSWTLGTGAATTLGNGVTVGGFEKLHVRLGTGDDVVSVASGNFASTTDSQYLDGGAGDDTLIGSNRRDILIGGIGNDILDGGDGNDAFRFAGAFGNDIVYNPESSLSTLDFVDPAITSLEYSKDGDHLIVGVVGTTNTVTAVDYFNTTASWLIVLNGVQQTVPSSMPTGTSPVPVGSPPTSSTNLPAMESGFPNLQATNFRDTIQLTESESGVDALRGNDEITSDENEHAINGDEGFDSVDYIASSAAVMVNLTTGVGVGGNADGDTFSSIELVRGSTLNDDLIGAESEDFLVGDSGNDKLDGRGGGDFLFGGDGNDVLLGRSGQDRLSGGAANDTLIGGAGADELRGEEGVDRAQYSDASASVKADLQFSQFNTGIAAGDSYSSIENLTGSGHQDDLRGDDIGNRIVGGNGGDILSGRKGEDTLIGGNGNDVLVGGAAADVLDGGDGTDRAQYQDSATGLRSDLQFAQFNTGIAEGDIYISVENLRGSGSDDDLRGDAEDNRIEGLNGNDVISGRDGDDTLLAGNGNDVLLGGGGGDALFGGSGTDRAQYSDATAGVTADLQNAAFNAGSFAVGDSYSQIENLSGSSFGDSLRGNGFDNMILGGAARDFLAGRNGDDELIGGDGDDVLIGGNGGDIHNGGAGIDQVSYIDAVSGVQADLQFAQFNTGIAIGDTYVDVENLRGSRATDNLRGDAASNKIEGFGGNDVLAGRNGDDELRGGAGDDYLIGGNGNDILAGSSGDDVYRFNAPNEGIDTILDFIRGQDSIHLNDSGFSALSTGALGAGNFVNGAAALDGDDFILYDAGALYYDADGNGVGAAVQIATLANSAAIDETDFLVI